MCADKFYHYIVCNERIHSLDGCTRLPFSREKKIYISTTMIQIEALSKTHIFGTATFQKNSK